MRRRLSISSSTRRTGGSTRRGNRTPSRARSTRWVGSSSTSLNRGSGFVVDSHARVALAPSRSEATVPVLYVDLEPDEKALILATLDPISAMAGRESKSDVIHATFERIVIEGPRVVRLRLTPAAYRHGLALPEYVALARPTVSEFTTS